MAVYSVTYDLRKEGRDYNGLITELESFTHYKYQKSAWLIKSTLSSKDVYNQLKPFIDDNDLLLVISVNNNKHGRLTSGSWEKINALFD